MDMDIKNRLLMGALGAAVLGAAGYGLYQETARSRNRAAQTAAGGAELTPSAGPFSPQTLQIETEAAVLPGSTGHRAWVTNGSGLRFEWTIQGGTLESGADQDLAYWTAGEAGEAVLICRGFNEAGLVALGVSKIQVKLLPTLVRFEVQPAVITQGSPAKLTWTAKDFRKLVLNPGTQDVTTAGGPGFEVKPAETTTYTLVATNDAGDAVTRELTLKVVPPPQLIALRAEPKAGASDAFTVVGEFKGGTAELSDGSGVLARQEVSPLRVELSALRPGTSLRFVVTNEAGDAQISTILVPAAKP